MAVTINASTSNGLTQSADVTGILELQCANNPVATFYPGMGTAGKVTGTTANSVLALTGNLNTYVQTYLFNANNGTSASADFTAYPNNGLDSSGWVSTGITSENFAQSVYSVTGPNEGYLFMSNPAAKSALTGNLVIATDSTGASNSIQFYTKGFNQAKTGYKLQIEGNSGLLTGAVRGNSPGLYQNSQYYRLNTAVAGTNTTTAQSIFGVAPTLTAATQYEFEAVVILNKTAGTTSHTIGISFGGTATINNIGGLTYTAWGSGLVLDGTALVSTTNTAFTVSITSAAVTHGIIIKGTVSINTGGTFIPQYTLSAAPGGAYSTQPGSFIKISALGASGSNINIGSWA